MNGYDYVSPENEGYIPTLLIVSKIVNTNCLYYNYDDIKTVDNFTGSEHEINGVVKSVNDDGTLDISYLDDEYSPVIASLELDENTNTLEIGDFIKSKGKVTSFSEDFTIYKVNEIEITKKADYEKELEEILKGKSTISSSIEYNYQSESGYDGFVYCTIYSNEGDVIGYIRIFYDFFENNTESFLGRANNPVESNYGIHEHEMVDITLKGKITDLTKMEAKSFEFIAD